jgi:hypothetical protein
MMMVSHRTRTAKKNLREGIKKMESDMSAASRVRRQFRLGRPPKSVLPLHPRVAVDKAEALLSDFREMMKVEGLKPEHVDTLIVAIREAAPDEPLFISLVNRDAAIAALSAPDTIALGCVFGQFDAKQGQTVEFPVQFGGLNERGINVMRKAVAKQFVARALAKGGSQ